MRAFVVRAVAGEGCLGGQELPCGDHTSALVVPPDVPEEGAARVHAQEEGPRLPAFPLLPHQVRERVLLWRTLACRLRWAARSCSGHALHALHADRLLRGK